MSEQNAVDLNDEVWTLAHIAKLLNYSEDYTARKIICQPGFPKGFRPVKTLRGERRWWAYEIRQYWGNDQEAA